MLKKLSFFTALIIASTISSLGHAQSSFGSTSSQSISKNNVRTLLGFTKGSINIGADYEKRVSNVRGYGGYFFFQTDDETAGIQQLIALGGSIPLHLLNDNVDVYFAPGFGFGIIDDPTSGNETIIGPSLKMGLDYRINAQMKAGIQYSTYYNWLNDQVASHADYTSAALTFGF